MEHGSKEKPSTSNVAVQDDDAGTSALNATILNYYKNFGRKRDLEQYFSLSTVEGEVSDPTSLFWRKLKMSDSDGERNKSESPVEICKISITCSQPEGNSSLEEVLKSHSSDSPPIVTEDIATYTVQQSDEELEKSDDNNSQKSLDRTLDTSLNKANSPTSSITSQRKLEWDSLADVGYANEADRKNSASSLSTLERLALHQQYSNTDTQNPLGPPTAHSTPQDEDNTSKNKRSSKITKIHRKDVDLVEVTTSEHNVAQTLNVNLTKHISFNVDKGGEVTVGVAKNNISISDKEMNNNPVERILSDKEIQTTSTEKHENLQEQPTQFPLYRNAIPVLINVNAVRKRRKLNRLKSLRKKIKSKKKLNDDKENVMFEKSGDQVSAAESFEYMPGDVYNQNQRRNIQPSTSTAAGNKSSLESSRGATTTDSSKGSKHSFSAELEKNLNFLKIALHKRFTDFEYKKSLIKEIVRDLIKTSCNDESSTEFLSGLSFNSKQLGLSHHSTSTSDTGDKKLGKPKKSILRDTRLNTQDIATSSQCVPILLTKNNKSIQTTLTDRKESASDTDASQKLKNSYDNLEDKSSSEELYRKYIDALQREKARKKYLRDKELFLRQKLSSSENALKIPANVDKKVESKLRDLMNDLIRNNYSDGSGDASNIEKSPGYPLSITKNNAGDQKARSIFTVSSSSSDKAECHEIDKHSQNEAHFCCCPYHFKNFSKVPADLNIVPNADKDINIQDPSSRQNQLNNNKTFPLSNLTNDNMNKCSCLKDKPLQLQAHCNDNLPVGGKEIAQPQVTVPNSARTASTQYNNKISSVGQRKSEIISEKITKSCQTNVNFKLVTDGIDNSLYSTPKEAKTNFSHGLVYEATRSVQTEISINPTKMEPLLNDIKIISDSECVNLISESCRQLNKNTRQFKNKDDGITPGVAFGYESTSTESLAVKENKTNSVEPLKMNITYEEESQGDIYIVDRCSKGVQSDDIPISTGIKIQSVNDFEDKSLRQDKTFKSSHKMNGSQDINSNDLEHQEEVSENFEEEKNVSSLPKPKTISHNSINSTTLNKKAGTLQVTEDVSKNVLRRSQFSVECLQNVVFGKTEFRHNSSIENSVGEAESSKVPLITNNTTSGKETRTIPPFTRSNTDSEVSFEKKNVDLGTKQYKTFPFQKRDELDKQTVSAMDVSYESFGKKFHESKKDKKKDTEKTFNNNSYESCVSKEKLSDDETEKDISLHDKNNVNSEFSSECSTNLSRKSLSNHKTVSSEESNHCKDILELIQDITKRYTKKNIKKNQKKKCFVEIMKLLNYLLDTEDPQENNKNTASDSKTSSLSGSKVSLGNAISKPSVFDIEKPNRNQKDTLKYKANNGKSDARSSEYKKGVFKTDDYSVIYREKSKRNSRDEAISAIPLDKTVKALDVQCSTDNNKEPIVEKKSIPEKAVADKGIQISSKKRNYRHRQSESSETPRSTDLLHTSSDNTACKIFTKIKDECERYHRKRCSNHGIKRCGCSSSTSVSCEICRCTHFCYCRAHKHRSHRGKALHKSESNTDKNTRKTESDIEKIKCVAYNLILQSSDNMTVDESFCNTNTPLQNIVLKVPTKPSLSKLPFNEVSAKIENKINECPNIDTGVSLDCDKKYKINDENRAPEAYTSVRDYLEKNRPDFVEECMKRQKCLKLMRQKRANEHAAHRQVFSMQVQMQPSLTQITEGDLRRIAKQLGIDTRKKVKPVPKLISEREMKKHSEVIYNSLPEVTKKKDDAKKESIKKTNLLLANMFKKNLQKKVLRGTVNLPNYATVVKI